MTTIAYRNGVLAADSRASYSSGTIDPAPITKLQHFQGSRGVTYAVAAAGSPTAGYAFMRRLRDLLMLTSSPDIGDSINTAVATFGETDAIAIILAAAPVFGARSLIYADNHGWHDYDIFPGFYNAWGSGGDFALGAMAAHESITAKMAVDIACTLDGRSGPPVHSFDATQLK